MSYTALYRKWRPAAFEDVKGQDHIVQTLKNQIESNRIGHAYLFCGTRGTGKTSIAKIFARAVNCENPVNGSPCGQCRTCRNIAAGASLNVVEIDAASNNGVENIREIRDEVQYPPTEGKYRVYIIDEVHMLSTGAFNALLKTLEEPPSYVIFILATTEVQKIPVTVMSRCQRYDFKRITVETITDRLKELTAAENIQVEDQALNYIAKAADGALRDALSLLDQCVAFHYGELLTYENVLDVLGAVDITVFSQMFRAVTENRTKDCITCLEEMVIQGRELGQFVVDFIWYLRNLLILKTVDEPENLLDMSAENIALLREDGKKVSGEDLLRYIRIFSDLSNQLRYASQKRILVEVALIRLTRPQMEENVDSLAQRIRALEKLMENGVLASVSPSQSVPAGREEPLPREEPAKPVILPKAQFEDLNLIRNEWRKITCDLGGSARACMKDTVVEPAGEGCLCIVFPDQSSYMIGSRPGVLQELKDYVEEHYDRSILFRARAAAGGERLDTVYVSDEELKANIHMDIVIEDE